MFKITVEEFQTNLGNLINATGLPSQVVKICLNNVIQQLTILEQQEQIKALQKEKETKVEIEDNIVEV